MQQINPELYLSEDKRVEFIMLGGQVAEATRLLSCATLETQVFGKSRSRLQRQQRITHLMHELSDRRSVLFQEGSETGLWLRKTLHDIAFEPVLEMLATGETAVPNDLLLAEPIPEEPWPLLYFPRRIS